MTDITEGTLNARKSMTVELIGFITLVVGLTSLFCGPQFIVYTFFCFTLLGASAAFILDSLGGTNISPAHLLLGFLSLKIFSNPDFIKHIKAGLTPNRAGFWLLATVIYSLISAFVMPRLFDGEIVIFSVRSLTGYSVLLTPSISNLTQSIYFTGDLVCFVTLYGYASSTGGIKVLGQAALACCALNLLFAAIDLLTYFTGTSDLLSFVRNANYAMMSDSEVAGFKRIVGFFTEASSFSYATLGYFAFSSRLWLLGIRQPLTLSLTLLSLTALIFSTSTTAYVGLAVFLAFTYLQISIQSLHRRLTPNMTFVLLAMPFVLALIVIVISLNDAYSSYVMNLLDTMVFNKMNTASGVERSAWNQQALKNFFDTFGLGVGNGSVRASSFPIAVLASIGFFGAVIFSIFFIRLLLGKKLSGEPRDQVSQAYQEAAKSSCVAWLIAATTSGALIDLGLPFFAFAALACADANPIGYGVRTKLAERAGSPASYSPGFRASGWLR